MTNDLILRRYTQIQGIKTRIKYEEEMDNNEINRKLLDIQRKANKDRYNLRWHKK